MLKTTVPIQNYHGNSQRTAHGRVQSSYRFLTMTVRLGKITERIHLRMTTMLLIQER